MRCPRCDAKSKVSNSRTSDAADDTRNAYLVDWASAAVGWYTQDWVVRHRKCAVCGWNKNTIELIGDDLSAMLKHAAHGGDNHG